MSGEAPGRTVRSDLQGPGIGRRRCGRGFRWHATVLAAVGLAVSATAPENGRKRAAARVSQEVAGYLGNTPAVARSAYIDPAVFARYQRGTTIEKVLDELGSGAEFGELATQGCVEAAVLQLLRKRA